MIIDPSSITVGSHGDVQLRVEEVSRFVAAQQDKPEPSRVIQNGCANDGCSGTNSGCTNSGCH